MPGPDFLPGNLNPKPKLFAYRPLPGPEFCLAPRAAALLVEGPDPKLQITILWEVAAVVLAPDSFRFRDQRLSLRCWGLYAELIGGWSRVKGQGSRLLNVKSTG